MKSRTNHPDPGPVLDLIAELLGEKGCWWDKEQTPASLCDYLLGETYELVEAIRGGDDQEIQEELGDVFFLLFFLARLLEQNFGFCLETVWQQNVGKMQRRHPHVFGNEQLETHQKLSSQWEAIKRQERSESRKALGPEHLFDSIPSILPPLLKAYALHSKAAKDGFTWVDDADQEQALAREWQEWNESLSQANHQAREEEYGDLLFSLVEQGRRHGVKANGALTRANLKFSRRFRAMCTLAEQQELDWEQLDLQAKDRLWEKVKQMERGEEEGRGAGE